jgi:hypothetical protein
MPGVFDGAVLSVNEPNASLDSEAKVRYTISRLNEALRSLWQAVFYLSGAGGDIIQLFADLDMQDHRILNLAYPVDQPDGSNKQYVDDEIERLQQQIDILKEELDQLVINPGVIVVLRAVPTVVNDIVEIGNFKVTGSGQNLDIAITVSDTNFSVSKRWLLSTNKSINSDWQIAIPLVSTGPQNSNNFDLDVKQVDADEKIYLRIRRTAGATVATATVHIHLRGVGTTAFFPTSATASVTAPTTFLEDAILVEVDGHVLVQTQVPGQTFTGSTNLTVSGVGTSSGAGVFEGISQATDADELATVILSATDKNSTNPGDKRAGLIAGLLSGTTANNRGGVWDFYTKIDGGTITRRTRLDNRGNWLVNSVVAPASMQYGVSMKNGTAPTADVADQNSEWSDDQAAGNSARHFRTENGAVIKLYRETALTAADNTAIDAIYDATEQAVLNNVRTRVNEIEARMQNLGFLP